MDFFSYLYISLFVFWGKIIETKECLKLPAHGSICSCSHVSFVNSSLLPPGLGHESVNSLQASVTVDTATKITIAPPKQLCVKTHNVNSRSGCCTYFNLSWKCCWSSLFIYFIFVFPHKKISAMTKFYPFIVYTWVFFLPFLRLFNISFVPTHHFYCLLLPSSSVYDILMDVLYICSFYFLQAEVLVFVFFKLEFYIWWGFFVDFCLIRFFFVLCVCLLFV